MKKESQAELIKRLTDEAEERAKNAEEIKDYSVDEMHESMLSRLRPVGVSEMDKQHEKLVEYMTELYALMREVRLRKPTKEEMQTLFSVLNGLQDYTVKHFTEEEILMEKMGYPDLNNHKAIHKKFVSKFVDIKLKIYAGHTHYLVDLFFLVFGWLFDHINQVDSKYGAYYNAQK